MSEDVFELMQKASVRRMERPTEHPLRDSQPLRRVEVPVLVHSSTIQDLGLTPFHLTRRAGFTRVVRGVVAHPTRKVSVDVPRWADERWMGVRLRVAALQLSRPEAVASHGTAALLHGWVLPGRMQRGDQIHLTTDVSAVRRREVVSHRYEVSDVLDAYGIRLTGLSETLRDIADGLSDVQLLELLEGVCGHWHGTPSVTPEELLAAVPHWPRFRGSARLLRVLPYVRADVGSPQETQLRRTIVANGLPEPRVAHPVVIAGITFHPDLSYPDLRIAIEYEGDQHRTDARQWDSDIRREGLFRDVGWAYFRVTRSTNMREFLDRLEAEVTHRNST